MRKLRKTTIRHRMWINSPTPWARRAHARFWRRWREKFCVTPRRINGRLTKKRASGARAETKDE